MGTLLMRRELPTRRKLWTQKVKIDNQTVYMTVGEYEDGTPGEIFIDVSKQGTFLRGVMSALARTVSIALQCGASVDTIVYALRGLEYPPNGKVEGSSATNHCTSVTDWIASELESLYMSKEEVISQEEDAQLENRKEQEIKIEETNNMTEEEKQWLEANKLQSKIAGYKSDSMWG